MVNFAHPNRRWRGTTFADRVVAREFSLGGYDVGQARPGASWFVDALGGSDSNDGKSWDRAFLTMGAAFAQVESGDTIYFVGKVREQLTAPVQVFDVTIIGAGTSPRHADALPTPIGGASAATWTTPASGATTAPLLTVLQQGFHFHNVTFAGPSDHSCVRLMRSGAGDTDAERDASHAHFYGCRFASGQDGLEQSGGAGHVRLVDCFFTSLTGVALKHTGGAGIGYPIRWESYNSRFHSCPSIMTAVAAFDYSFQGNEYMFDSAPTLVFDFTGGARNNMGGRMPNSANVAAANWDPAGGVTGSGATDVWRTILTDADEVGLPAN